MSEGIDLDNVNALLLHSIGELYDKADDLTLNAAALMLDAELLNRKEKEMVITVKRTECANSTTGELFIDGARQCVTLEDKCRKDSEKKVYGETAIPYGKYEITLRKEGTIYEDYKKRFADIGGERGTLWVRNIPGFEYVLIHVGNYLRDTLGCLLVGSSFVNHEQIAESTKAYRKIYPIIANALEHGEKVLIEYIKA